ncbi:zinc finger protein ZAT5-like [Melia azedarach]|uniref:Zinc finger protein ZAT5-like n=1 Tax=Melia azedarach TaxID=155640 RepID=A0ACC1YB76_MELAZ|nr:zinc finger protein ZAT5-like [Melia azedarach]
MDEVREEASTMRSNNDQTSIVKGKRTKRQRPQSPIPFVVNSGEVDHNKNVTNLLSPPVSSAEEHLDSTEEDEDMANCLILLAQCQSRESPKRCMDQEEMGGQIHGKFNSRRFLEAPPSAGTGKTAGYYVYECKTCNRTFPSFQALGGHRASHKKPKAMNNEERLIKSQQFLVSSDEEDGSFRNVSSSLSLQLSNHNNNNNRGIHHHNNNNNNLYSSSSSNNNKGSKVHECSICGAEFTSGQALGGHMRRHRTPVGTNTTLSLTPMAVESDQEQKKPRNNVLSLDLDLNLPAPEDDPRESKLPFSSKQQQQQQQQQQQKSTLVFSAAPTLVDCHY